MINSANRLKLRRKTLNFETMDLMVNQIFIYFPLIINEFFNMRTIKNNFAKVGFFILLKFFSTFI